MKNTKIFALVATVALLVLGTAFTSFAAAKYNWYQQDDEWRCKDKNGDDYYDAWAKSGADWYWLNDEGYMATEALVDEDNKYVDAEGKMVANKWVKVTDEENEDHWMYFQAGGKKLAAKDGADPKPISVGSKKYIFDNNGYMMSGWVEKDNFDAADEDSWRTALYYCGDEDDGAVTYGWRQITCEDDTQDFIDNDYWFWFGTNGKKFFANTTGYDEDDAHLQEKTINGKKYAFDNNGVMKAEWEQSVVTASTASLQIGAYAWFHTVEDGSKLANGWFRVVPSEKTDATNYDDDTAKWFYAKGGKLYHDVVKTINGKKYAFANNGEMVTGLCALDMNKAEADDFFDKLRVSDTTAYAIGIDNADDMNAAVAAYTQIPGSVLEGYGLYYFSDDEDNDGAMKTGSQKVTVDGDDYDFYFSTKAGSKGCGITGKQGNKYYRNGKKVAANDEIADYLFYECTYDATTGKKTITSVGYAGATFASKIGEVDARYVELISKAGSVASSGTKKDGNGYKATFKKDKPVNYPKGYWKVEAE